MLNFVKSIYVNANIFDDTLRLQRLAFGRFFKIVCTCVVRFENRTIEQIAKSCRFGVKISICLTYGCLFLLFARINIRSKIKRFSNSDFFELNSAQIL